MGLTREEIVIFAKCDEYVACVSCERRKDCYVTNRDAPIISALAKQLLVEMDKPKGLIVTTEKEQNVKLGLFLCDIVCEKYGSYTEKERELIVLAWDSCLASNNIKVKLKKSHEREIAEKYADKWDIHCDSIEQRRVADIIESAINEYKEWEAN